MPMIVDYEVEKLFPVNLVMQIKYKYKNIWKIVGKKFFNIYFLQYIKNKTIIFIYSMYLNNF